MGKPGIFIGIDPCDLSALKYKVGGCAVYSVRAAKNLMELTRAKRKGIDTENSMFSFGGSDIRVANCGRFNLRPQLRGVTWLIFD
jgi:hypothetical protein